MVIKTEDNLRYPVTRLSVVILFRDVGGFFSDKKQLVRYSYY